MKKIKKLFTLLFMAALLLGITAYSPVAVKVAKAANMPKKGTCGPGLSYTFDSTSGTLTIKGKGTMYDYDANDNKSPFSGHDDIRTVYIEEGVTSIGEWAFYDCFSIKEVYFMGKEIKKISYAAFYGCVGISTMELPENLTVIEKSAFEHCIAWKNFTLPKSVTEIGKWAFDDTGFYRDRSNWEDNVLYIGTFLYTAKYNEDYHNSNYMGKKPYVSDVYTYYKDMVTGNYTVKEGTTVIVGDAFYRTKLTGITIPDSVKTIGEDAFSNSGLESITIPKSVTKIEKYTFGYCKSLKEVTIQKGVKEIGEQAFTNCESLEKITLPTGLVMIDSEAFCKCGLKSVTIPKSVRGIGYRAFYWNSSLKSLTIKSGVRAVGEEAFTECEKLKSVTVPKSVTTIGARAFGVDYDGGKIKGFKLRGYKGSAAQKYAKTYKVKFVVISKK